MTIERLNPDTLLAPRENLNAQIVVATGRQVFINGQIARDGEGTLVGEGDIAAQSRQCWKNIRLALAAVGATGHDVVSYRMYVVDPAEGDAWRLIQEGRDEFGEEWPVAGAIFVGVTALGRPEYLVEIEATAVLG